MLIDLLIMCCSYIWMNFNKNVTLIGRISAFFLSFTEFIHSDGGSWETMVWSQNTWVWIPVPHLASLDKLFSLSLCWFLSLENNPTYFGELIWDLNEMGHVQKLSPQYLTEFSINIIFTVKHLLSTCFIPGPMVGAGNS